jgi:prolyl oligopeptidase
MSRLAVFIALLSLATGAAAQGAPAKPPAAPVHTVTTTYFGVDVSDPYRYMEKLDDPAVEAWIGKQGQYARATLDGIPGRAKLLAEAQSIEAARPARLSHLLALPGGRYLYLRQGPDSHAYDLYRSDGLSGKPALLVDAHAARFGGGADSTVTFFSPSFDGADIAYGISAAGTGKTTIRVLNAQTGQPLPDTIDGMPAPGIAWLPDARSFLYVRNENAGAGANPAGGQVLLHRLGSDPAKDVVVFGGGGAAAKVNAPGGPIVSVKSAAGSSDAVVAVAQGANGSLSLYAAPLAQIGKPTARWTRIGNDNVTILDDRLNGSALYLAVSGLKGPVVARVPLRDPNLDNWGLMLQLSPEQAITGLEAAADAVYVTVLGTSGISLVRVPYLASGYIERAALPFEGNVSLYAVDPRVSGVLAALSSWTQAPAVYRYDIKSGTMLRTNLRPAVPGEDLSNLVSTNVTALGSNGTLVPLAIVYEKGFQRDGTHPALLMQYGSGTAFPFPTFNPMWRVWLDRGGVLAFARVSGAGPYNGLGRDRESQIDWSVRIQNFLTCGQYLVAQGYTTPDRLAAIGAGEGAVVVGRAVTTDPKLFRAVVIESGILDPLRFEETTARGTNVPQFGNAKTLDAFRGLESLSSYEHVEAGVRYPAVLLETEAGDGQVPAWQSAKMAARLDASSASGLPVLLETKTGEARALASGQGGNAGLVADEASFLFWQLGEPGFQPAQTDAAIAASR